MSTLKTRLDKLEKGDLTPGNAKYVVRTPQEYFQLRERFRGYFPELGDTEEPEGDERYTYGEAVVKGIIVEAPGLEAAMNLLTCGERGFPRTPCGAPDCPMWDHHNDYITPCARSWKKTPTKKPERNPRYANDPDLFFKDLMEAEDQQFIEALGACHGAKASYVSTEHVHETHAGETVWEGDVEVYSLEGHADADTCYSWAEPGEERSRFFAVLKLGRVQSASDAVRAQTRPAG